MKIGPALYLVQDEAERGSDPVSSRLPREYPVPAHEEAESTDSLFVYENLILP